MKISNLFILFKNKSEHRNLNPNINTTADYFQAASSWADDYYLLTVTQKNRWRALSLYVLLPMTFLLLSCVLMLVPLQHLEPLLINHYDNGVVTVEPLTQKSAPINRAQTESDLVRYVINRESYSTATYHEQYSLINLLSNESVSDDYLTEQSTSNTHSPINQLGNQGSRNVHVESVVFLENVNGNNSNTQTKNPRHTLAQVNFTVTTDNKQTGLQQQLPLTVLISWEYRGIPNNPELAWQNWDGFTVTHYKVQQRNV